MASSIVNRTISVTLRSLSFSYDWSFWYKGLFRGGVRGNLPYSIMMMSRRTRTRTWFRWMIRTRCLHSSPTSPSTKQPDTQVSGRYIFNDFENFMVWHSSCVRLLLCYLTQDWLMSWEGPLNWMSHEWGRNLLKSYSDIVIKDALRFCI